MTDTTGGAPRPPGGDQPSGDEQQPPAQPSPGPAQQPYGQPHQPYGAPRQPFGAPPPSRSPYGYPPSQPTQPTQPEQGPPSYTQQYGQPYSQQGYSQPGYGQPGGGYAPPPSDKRPATVTAAGVVTLVTAGLVFVLLAVTLVTVLAAGPDSEYIQDVVDEMARQNEAYEDFSAQTIVNIAAVGIGIALAWALIAMLLAVFAMRRSNPARIGLVVSAAVVCVPTALIGLAGAFAMLILGAACVVVIVCLFAGGANEWYARRPGARPRSGGLAPPVA